MNKREILHLVTFGISIPFFVTDTVVCAKINQELLDSIPMNVDKVLIWGIRIILYLLIFRVFIGLFYKSTVVLTKGITKQIRESIYDCAGQQKIWLKKETAVSSTLNNDIYLLEKDYYSAWIMLIVKSLEVILACIVAFNENAYYGIFCFIVMILPVLCSGRRAVKVGKINQGIQDTSSEYMDFISKIGHGKETIHHYNLLETVLGCHGGIAGRLTEWNICKKNELSKSMIINQNMNRCANGVVSLFGFYLAGKGVLSLGWVMAFSQLASSMTYTLAEVIQEGMKIYASRSVKQRIFEEYELSGFHLKEQKERAEIDITKASEGMGLVCNIKQYCIDEKEILSDIHFSLNSGDKALIIGGNGAGKTTLLKLILGLIEEKEYEGCVKWVNAKGEDILCPESNMAYMPQSPFVFHETVKDNIILNGVFNQQKYEDVKLLTGLQVIDEKIVNHLQNNVSGGEKQKIGLARVLYSCRNTFILDEPYSALDQQSLLGVERSILSDPQRTVITISHVRSENQEMYNKILVIENGKLIQK